MELREPSPVSAMDMVESGEMIQQLKKAGEYSLLTATEKLASISLQWHPPSKFSVGHTLHSTVSDLRDHVVDLHSVDLICKEQCYRSSLASDMWLGPYHAVVTKSSKKFATLSLEIVHLACALWTLQLVAFTSRTKLLDASPHRRPISTASIYCNLIVECRTLSDACVGGKMFQTKSF